MKLKIKLIATLMLIIMTATTAMASPYKADAKTKRIPAGTKLKLQLIEPVNTISGYEGAPFTAMLMEDQVSGVNVILPAGSVVRGTIRDIKPTKRLSRGAVLYLDFDHVVTPNGRQLPLDMSIYNRTDLTIDGGIYGSKGYGQALKDNWTKAVEITKNSTEFGSDLGDKAFSGANYITTPVCAVGGAFGGAAFLFGDSIADLFKKGKDVILIQGTELDVMLSYPIDVPMN